MPSVLNLPAASGSVGEAALAGSVDDSHRQLLSGLPFLWHAMSLSKPISWCEADAIPICLCNVAGVGA